jgi:twitching motility protein PilU
VAVEILLNTPLAAQTIKAGEVDRLKDVMKQSNQLGMITFDQALHQLYRSGDITYDDALHHADSANELRLMIKLDQKSGFEDNGGSLDGITLVNIDEI